jgi:hypothetical protein
LHLLDELLSLGSQTLLITLDGLFKLFGELGDAELLELELLILEGSVSLKFDFSLS